MPKSLRYRRGDTTLVIPQRNHADLTAACIDSALATDPVPWSVIVVDDASRPFAPLRVRLGPLTPRSTVRVVRHPEHRGVAAAWNTGARHACTPLLVWLNNDVIARGPWVRRLTEPIRDGRLDVVGVAWRTERAVGREQLAALGRDRFPQGWCFAARRDDWQRLGGFDEAMAVYWSDTDFFLRAEAAGLRIGVIEHLPLEHLGHRTAHDPASLPERRRIWASDRARFLEKYRSEIEAFPRNGARA